MTRKIQAHTRWAGVSATSPGARKESVDCSRPRHPRPHRPTAAKSNPVPPSKAIKDATLHTTVLAVASLPTNGSGGQLLV